MKTSNDAETLVEINFFAERLFLFKNMERKFNFAFLIEGGNRCVIAYFPHF